MLCKKCGKELREGAMFCSNCGCSVESESDKAKKRNLIIGVVAGIVVIVLALVGILAKPSTESVGKDNTQNTQDTFNSQQESEKESEGPKYTAIYGPKTFESEGIIDFDDLNEAYVKEWEYDEDPDWGYTEVQYQTMNGYGRDLHFSFIHYERSRTLGGYQWIHMGKLDDHAIEVYSKGDRNLSNYYMWVGAEICYKGDSYDEAYALKNNDNYSREFPRVKNGECVVDAKDKYIKIYYAVENETHKGYEGVICDENKGKMIRFVYVEVKEKYDEERAKIVVESIKVMK